MRLTRNLAAGFAFASAVVAGVVAAPSAPAQAQAQTTSFEIVDLAAAKKTVALTFDDGPSKYTPQILDILKRNKVKATFCMLGNNVGPYAATARRVVREGHRLCNHSRSHPNFTKLSNTAARNQVVWTQNKIYSVTKVRPKVFRFPYGASNSRTRTVVRAQNLRILGWTVDTRDWSRPGTATITSRAVKGTRPGAVILMHDGGGNRSQTVASLNATIRQLKAKGYTFVLA